VDDKEIKKLITQIATQTAALVAPSRSQVCHEHRHIVDGLEQLVSVQERQTGKLEAIHGDVIAVRESHREHRAWHNGREHSTETQISKGVYWIRMLGLVIIAASAFAAAVWAVAKVLP